MSNSLTLKPPIGKRSHFFTKERTTTSSSSQVTVSQTVCANPKLDLKSVGFPSISCWCKNTRYFFSYRHTCVCIWTEEMMFFTQSHLLGSTSVCVYPTLSRFAAFEQTITRIANKLNIHVVSMVLQRRWRIYACVYLHGAWERRYLHTKAHASMLCEFTGNTHPLYKRVWRPEWESAPEQADRQIERGLGGSRDANWKCKRDLHDLSR